MSATRLVAKPYQPEPRTSPVRSYGEYAGRFGRDLGWPELEFGERGNSVRDIRFAGLEIQRDMNLGSDTAGGFLQASRQPQTVVEYVGAQLLTRRMGAQYVPSSAEDFSAIPVEKTPAPFQWLGEGGTPDEVDNTFGGIAPSIKWGVAWQEFTRALSVTTDRLADRLLARSNFASVARGIDRAVFHGSGVDGQPTGIINVPNVGSIDGGTFSLLKACSMLKAVEDGFADTSSLSWAMDPATAEKLRQRPKASGGERMLFEDGKILDRPAHVSAGIDAGTLFLGDFTQAVVMVRDIELLVNPSTKSTFGVIQFLAYWYGDIVVLRPPSFCVATAVS